VAGLFMSRFGLLFTPSERSAGTPERLELVPPSLVLLR
jgi:hypothetical protein